MTLTATRWPVAVLGATGAVGQVIAAGKGAKYRGAAVYFAVSDNQGASFRGDFKLADYSCECCRIAMLPHEIPRRQIVEQLSTDRAIEIPVEFIERLLISKAQ